MSAHLSSANGARRAAKPSVHGVLFSLSCCKRSRREGFVFASEAKISEMLAKDRAEWASAHGRETGAYGSSVRTVRREIQKLRAAGKISVERPSRTSRNRIVVHAPPDRVTSSRASKVAARSERDFRDSGQQRASKVAAPKDTVPVFTQETTGRAAESDVLLLEKNEPSKNVEQPLPIIGKELDRVASVVLSDVAPTAADPPAETVIEPQHVNELLPGVGEQLKKDYVRRLVDRGFGARAAVERVREFALELDRIEHAIRLFDYQDTHKPGTIRNKPGWITTAMRSGDYIEPKALHEERLQRDRQRAREAREARERAADDEQIAREAKTRAAAQERIDSMPRAAREELAALARAELVAEHRKFGVSGEPPKQFVHARELKLAAEEPRIFGGQDIAVPGHGAAGGTAPYPPRGVPRAGISQAPMRFSAPVQLAGG